MEKGVSIRTIVNTKKWGTFDCKERFDHPNYPDYPNYPKPWIAGGNSTFLIADSSNIQRCFLCLDVLGRTPNVIQIRRGRCLYARNATELSLNRTCTGVQRLPGDDEVVTLFRVTDERNVNCSSTIEGFYQFTYEMNNGGGGICDNQDSQIKACVDPGSPYVDNQVFRMQYAICRDVNTSISKRIRYQCYGTWFAVRDGKGYTYAAIADTVEKDPRERFKCLVTKKTHTDTETKIYWRMSRFADCTGLIGVDPAPFELVLTMTPPSTNHLTTNCPWLPTIPDIVG